MPFYEFTKEGRIREIEKICHFFHRHFRVLQSVFDLFNGMLVDDL